MIRTMLEISRDIQDTEHLIRDFGTRLHEAERRLNDLYAERRQAIARDAAAGRAAADAEANEVDRAVARADAKMRADLDRAMGRADLEAKPLPPPPAPAAGRRVTTLIGPEQAPEPPSSWNGSPPTGNGVACPWGCGGLVRDLYFDSAQGVYRWHCSAYPDNVYWHQTGGRS